MSEINTTSENTEEVKEVEIIPSMDEFRNEINSSFRKINLGDIVTGTVIGVTDTEVIIDLATYAEAIIPLSELSNDPRFSIHYDIAVGDSISAVVLDEDESTGTLILSKKQADDVLAWDILSTAMQNRTIYTVKISNAVNSGVITYIEGLRAFIPASMLSLNYVEDVSSYVGKDIDVMVVTADAGAKKLVLSAKEVEREKSLQDKNSKISKLQKGLVTTGVVEKIASYGAFVNIGDGLSGLVHISEICGKRINTPNEVLKLGDEVTVKIIDIKEGKISLSIKQVDDSEDIIEDVEEAAIEYTSGETVSTSLSGLFKNIKLS